MDPPEYEWSYDIGTNAIVATTTTVIRTYLYLSRMHKIADPDVPLALVDILELLPTPSLAPWNLSLLPLPNFKIESMSPGLLSVKILPQPAVSVIELSSTTTPVMVATSPP